MPKSRLKPPAREILTNPFHFLAFGFGSGLAPVAPGTFGTLAALPVWWILATLELTPYLAALIGLFALGVYISDKSEKLLGIEDPGGIVFDEIVGFLITMTAAPHSWQAVLAGFLLFRLFDVWKPWPIRALDRSIHGGFGIMLDDAVAGIFAAICLQAGLKLL